MKSMGVKQVIKNLDAFPRAEDHLLQRTQSGALGILCCLPFISSILCPIFTIAFADLRFCGFYVYYCV